MPKNKKTNIAYKGNNLDILEQVKTNKGYLSNEWVTFLQAKEMGLKIKKGEKGTMLVRVFDTDKTDTAGETKKAIKRFFVFNVEQCQLINK